MQSPHRWEGWPLMSEPKTVYLRMKGDLQTVLALPQQGKEHLFRDFLVGYLMVEHAYAEGRAIKLVSGNEAAILAMLTEETASGLW
jgi:hypothetical protein